MHVDDAVTRAFTTLLDALATELDRATARRVAAVWQRDAIQTSPATPDIAVVSQLHRQVSQLADAWAAAVDHAQPPPSRDATSDAAAHALCEPSLPSGRPDDLHAAAPPNPERAPAAPGTGEPAESGDAAAPADAAWAPIVVTRVASPAGERLGPVMFRRLILEALVQLGGRATWREIMAVLAERVAPWLSAADLEPLPYQPDWLRWHYTADWARRVLAGRTFIVYGPRTVWQISDAGRRWLIEQQTPG